MNIVFMGTPDFAKESLKALYEDNHNIIAVVTNPDKPKGRGMHMNISPVKEFAEEKGIKIFQPIKIRNNTEFIDTIKGLNPDLLCVVAYGKILPKELLEIPKYGAINVHGSLLPKYRGAAPIQWAVINGEEVTGITTMYMDEGMDTGDMILKEEVKILPDETTGELWNRLSIIGSKLLVETVRKVENGTAPRIKQPEDGTLAPMLSKEIAKIDWDKSGKEIFNLIRGINPIMGAYSFVNNKKIKIWKAKYTSFSECADIDENEINGFKNGTVVLSNPKKGLFIKVKDGVISILEIQGENAKKMDIKSFLVGNNIEVNTVFE